MAAIATTARLYHMVDTGNKTRRLGCLWANEKNCHQLPEGF